MLFLLHRPVAHLPDLAALKAACTAQLTPSYATPRTAAPSMPSQLADFGLAKILDKSVEHATNVHGAGTATHQAPELFMPGAKFGTAVDSYAFGVLAWEMYTGCTHPYNGALPRLCAAPAWGVSSRPVVPGVLRHGRSPFSPCNVRCRSPRPELWPPLTCALRQASTPRALSPASPRA